MIEGGALIASEDGSEIYQFSDDGRHRKTLDPVTGTARQQFSFDSEGRVDSVDDGHGNVTHISRDASGRPQFIDAPFGQRTSLSYDSSDYLATVTNSVGVYGMTYHAGTRALATFTKPTGGEWSFQYSSLGQLQN